MIDKEGNIEFPVLGKIHAEGLTKEELATKLQTMISEYVKDSPLVKVQLLNFKVTMMGEFNRPGSYTIKSDRVSILDVIGMAGDLPLTANRKNILVIRENDGTKEIHRLDMTSPDIFSSPCFYLKQNDVVYAEPIKTKQKAARTSSDRSFFMSLATSIISSVSSIVAIVISLSNKINGMEDLQKDNEVISLKKIIIYYIGQWKLFLSCGVISVLLSILYLAFYPKTYETIARIKIQEEKDLTGGGSLSLGDAAGLMRSFGLNSSVSTGINVDDEKVTLLSNSLLSKVVRS